MKISFCLLIILSFAPVYSDSLLDPQVLGNSASSPSSQFKRAKRERPVYDFRIRDTIMVNVNIDDTIEFTKKQDYKRDKSWGARFKSLVDNFGGAAKASLPDLEIEAENEVKSDGKKTDGSKVRLEVPCEIIEILPHGDLVLEGSRRVNADDSVANVKVGGRVNPKFINPVTDIVMSESILQLQVSTDFEGPLADNQKDGFISKLLDKFKLF